MCLSLVLYGSRRIGAIPGHVTKGADRTNMTKSACIGVDVGAFIPGCAYVIMRPWPGPSRFQLAGVDNGFPSSGWRLLQIGKGAILCHMIWLPAQGAEATHPHCMACESCSLNA